MHHISYRIYAIFQLHYHQTLILVSLMVIVNQKRHTDSYIVPSLHTEVSPMTVSLTPLIALIAGILILLMPKLLNYIVAGYLILVGITGLLGASGFNLSM